MIEAWRRSRHNGAVSQLLETCRPYSSLFRCERTHTTTHVYCVAKYRWLYIGSCCRGDFNPFVSASFHWRHFILSVVDLQGYRVLGLTKTKVIFYSLIPLFKIFAQRRSRKTTALHTTLCVWFVCDKHIEPSISDQPYQGKTDHYNCTSDRYPTQIVVRTGAPKSQRKPLQSNWLKLNVETWN
jgi:hypothetical protein